MLLNFINIIKKMIQHDKIKMTKENQMFIIRTK
ncbi:hypothetical protein COPEUT_00094 [Coprococcus eutactus ATCC 27759]|nr:hypothetical protein COPEUT_00094 [Coprococcus eutactus ATCC 27759]